jgi:energy-coupling factor transport system permease protein
LPEWFEYAPRRTFIHSLSPLSRVILLFSLLVVVGFYYDPFYLAIVGLMAAILFVVSRVPLKWLILLLPAMIYRAPEYVVVAIGQSFSPSIFKVLPPEMASRVIFELNLPFLGKVGLIYGGLLWAIGQEMHLPIVISLTLTLIYTTSLNEYIKLMRWLRVPYQLIYVITTALKFVPDIFRTYETINKAQRLRGWSIRTKNPVKAIRMMGPLLFPLTRQLIAYTDRLTISSQIRGFGASSVRYQTKLAIRKRDLVTMAISLPLFAIALYLLFTFNVGLL